MIYLRPQEIRHKSMLYKLLKVIADTPILTRGLRFKGGTCAAMAGYLDRFSVDLDFDFLPGFDQELYRKEFHTVFKKCGFHIDDESTRMLAFILKYESPFNNRNTLHVDALSIVWKANVYEPLFFPEISRTLMCQTRETIVSNKLATPFDRYKKHKMVAGRDFFDIYTFLQRGYGYNADLLKERTGKTPQEIFIRLIAFIKRHLAQKQIDEDLNILLPPQKFQAIRESLRDELLLLLQQEADRA